MIGFKKTVLCADFAFLVKGTQPPNILRVVSNLHADTYNKESKMALGNMYRMYTPLGTYNNI